MNLFSSESVAEPIHLYSAFDNVLYDSDYTIGNGMTVESFMSNWTMQSGYPVLNITKNETSNTFSVTQVIKQKLFSSNLFLYHDVSKKVRKPHNANVLNFRFSNVF